MSPPIPVILVDDHAMFRESLAEWFRAEGSVNVIACAGSAEEGLTPIIDRQPRVVIMDIDMPGLQSFDAIRIIRTRCPRTRVIVLSAFHHDRYIEQALEAEAAGYLTKSEPPESVLNAVHVVAAGGTCFSPQVRARMVADGSSASPSVGPTRGTTITVREREVLGYIARGLSDREIAETMHVAVKTASNHVANLMQRLDIHDRVGLTRYAIREGFSEP